jgi:hypothetical protein
MRLPPELRLMVYQIALRDITDPIMYPTSDKVQRPHPSRGALALLQTSKHMRPESHGAMWSAVHNHIGTLLDAGRAITNRYRETVDSAWSDDSAFTQYEDDYQRNHRLYECMEVAQGALRGARRAHGAYQRVENEKLMAKFEFHEADERAQQFSGRG